ncbi:MAG: hypothetical protein KAU95_02090 [Candidatus Aenigmarchaeota archaeon]|nr:hypothetical protein [Candidatus Aenigmarchaeota archaeon]
MSEEFMGGGAQMPTMEATIKASRDYTQNMVNNSGTGLGVTYDTGVVFVGYKNLPKSKLMVPDSVKKVYEIDDNIGIVYTGAVSDLRVLIDPPPGFGMPGARQYSQQYKLKYNELPDVEEMVDFTSEIQRQYDKNRLRGLGLDVALLMGGINVDGDEKSELYTLDIMGNYAGYKATAIGKHKDEVNELFERDYKDGMNLEEAKELAFDALVSSHIDEDLIPDYIECSVIDKGNKYKALNNDEIKELVDKASSKLKVE